MKTNVKKAKNDFQKFFFRLMNNAVFGITMENLKKKRELLSIRTKLSYYKAFSQNIY